MYKIKTTELGDTFVSKEALETLAGLATIDCYGLVGMVPQNIQSGLTSILGIESIRKGVIVRPTEDGLIIDVHVVIGYGIKISEVAHNVMQKVTYVLETNAGVDVKSVNVNIKGVKVLREN
mgnify:CR=1 FL=1